MPSELKERLKADLTGARKAREKLTTLVLSMTLSELRNREIELGHDADDEVVTAVITKAIKQRKDAAAQMREGGRSDLAEKEEEEAEVLSKYLPEPMEEEEVREIIRSLIAEGKTEMGPLMGALMPCLKGRFDGKEANRLVREALAG